MFKLDTVITGKVRTNISDEFTNKADGEIVAYQQLQVELKDDKGRLSIENISVPKKFWDEASTKILNGYMDKTVNIPVSVTGSKSGSLKLSLFDLPKTEASMRQAS